MDYKKQETEKLQWHPALYAGLQIELREDSDNLIFEMSISLEQSRNRLMH